jgi:hypothetical protein
VVDKLSSWRVCTSASYVGGQLSSVSKAAFLLGFPLPPYAGARAVLAYRGAFEPRRHSRRYPVTTHMVIGKLETEPRPWSAELQGIADALTWHSFFAFRPGMLLALTKSMWREFGDGFLLRWVLKTKTRRGDRLVETMSEPFVTAAAHWRLAEIFHRAPDTGLMFPVNPAAVRTILHRWFDVEAGEDFEVQWAGLRNGTDVALRALAVPDDVIDAHGGWKRVLRTSTYYAGLAVHVLLGATRLLDQAVVRPVAPGWFDVVAAPRVPPWKASLASQVLPVFDAAEFEVDPDDEVDERAALPAPPLPTVSGAGRGCRRADMAARLRR